MNPVNKKHSLRIMNLIIRDLSDLKWEIRAVNFWVESTVEDPEKALRDAVQDFLDSGTEEAKTAVEYSADAFNWGDVLNAVPNAYFQNRGLHRIDGYETVDVSVEHNEILCAAANPTDPELVYKRSIRQEVGVCPECGYTELEYGDSGIESEGYAYEWLCPICGTEGVEWYDLVFSTQMIKRQETGKVEAGKKNE